MTTDGEDDRIEPVVFFLSDALRSILQDGAALREARCAPPSIGPEASSDDIFLRLDHFRQEVRDLRGREAIMTAKLARAREWAEMLKGLAPHVKPEINLFLLSTVFYEDLQQAMLPNPVETFHGGNLSRRILGERMKDASAARHGEHGAGPSASYLIAGKVRIDDLTHPCERFLTSLDQRFSFYSETGEDADAVLDLDEDMLESLPPLIAKSLPAQPAQAEASPAS